MKEIHHNDNRHLDAAQKIRAEADELGFSEGFLTYGDAPVSHALASPFLDAADDCVLKRMRFANAMWDETARLNTVSPAGQMEAAADDVLPAVPELNLPPRIVKK